MYEAGLQMTKAAEGKAEQGEIKVELDKLLEGGVPVAKKNASGKEEINWAPPPRPGQPGGLPGNAPFVALGGGGYVGFGGIGDPFGAYGAAMLAAQVAQAQADAHRMRLDAQLRAQALRRQQRREAKNARRRANGR